MTGKPAPSPSRRSLLLAAPIVLLGTIKQRPASAFYQARDLRVLILEADAVIAVKVLGAELPLSDGEICGKRYAGLVQEIIKSSSPQAAALSPGSRIEFGRYDGLEIRREYILFIRWTRPEREYDALAPEFKRMYPRERALELLACKGLLPGPLYSQELLLEIVGNKVVIPQLPPSDIPEHIGMRFDEDKGAWSIEKQAMFKHLRSLVVQ